MPLFSAFRRSDREARTAPVQPVPAEAVVRSITVPIQERNVVIVNPDPAEAYRLKARFLHGGHREIDTFFHPESLLAVLVTGHRPDVVIVDDFVGEGSRMTGIELARALRLEHGFGGLLYTSAADHRYLSPDALAVHGFSGHLSEYLGR